MTDNYCISTVNILYNMFFDKLFIILTFVICYYATIRTMTKRILYKYPKIQQKTFSYATKNVVALQKFRFNSFRLCKSCRGNNRALVIVEQKTNVQSQLFYHILKEFAFQNEREKKVFEHIVTLWSCWILILILNEWLINKQTKLMWFIWHFTYFDNWNFVQCWEWKIQIGMCNLKNELCTISCSFFIFGWLFSRF